MICLVSSVEAWQRLAKLLGAERDSLSHVCDYCFLLCTTISLILFYFLHKLKYEQLRTTYANKLNYDLSFQKVRLAALLRNAMHRQLFQIKRIRCDDDRSEHVRMLVKIMKRLLICLHIADHILGRPSVQFRKSQVLAVVAFWSVYLYK